MTTRPPAQAKALSSPAFRPYDAIGASVDTGSMIRLGVFEPSERDDVVLSEAECRRLLATRTLGRVGLTSGALPMIMPVEYVYEDGVITFRTEHDAKLRAAIHGAVLAFEVDAYEPGSALGWSVHVLGRATVADGDDGDDSVRTDGTARQRHYSVRLHCEIVSGRRMATTRA